MWQSFESIPPNFIPSTINMVEYSPYTPIPEIQWVFNSCVADFWSLHLLVSQVLGVWMTFWQMIWIYLPCHNFLRKRARSDPDFFSSVYQQKGPCVTNTQLIASWFKFHGTYIHALDKCRTQYKCRLKKCPLEGE